MMDDVLARKQLAEILGGILDPLSIEHSARETTEGIPFSYQPL